MPSQNEQPPESDLEFLADGLHSIAISMVELHKQRMGFDHNDAVNAVALQLLQLALKIRENESDKPT